MGVFLSLYNRKRNFEKSPEPKGKRSFGNGARFPTFVVQEHHARRLHYDFRLEIGGALKSWAVPKGVSSKPLEKRLAVMTEDHPLDYVNFEGTIPQGEYGGGTVSIWDRGFFLNLTSGKKGIEPAANAVEQGHLSFWLQGVKLKGKFTLTRMGRDSNSWLLIKRYTDRSVLSYIEEASRPVIAGAKIVSKKENSPALQNKKNRRSSAA